MIIINKVFLTLYFLVAFLNIWFSFNQNKKGKGITLVMLMPLLLLYLLFSSGDKYILVVLALILGFFGDLLLTLSQKIAGGVCFLVGHICYIIAISSRINFSKFSIVSILALITVIIVVTLLYRSLSKGLGNLKIPVILYMVAISSMFAFSILLFIGQPSYNTVLTPLGALFFIVCDYTIAYSTFRKPFNYHDVLSMSSYILAQFLLVISLT